MSLWKKSLTFFAAAALLAGSVAGTPAMAVTKKKAAAKASAPGTGDNAKISSDPDAPTVKENRLLKWGPVDPPDRGKKPEFFFRGVFVDMTPTEGGAKDMYQVTFLPVEIVENEYRNVTADNFINGMILPVYMPAQLKKQMKKGGIVEVHEYYTTAEEQAIGHAHMIGFTYHQDLLPYPVGPAAYVKKGGLDQEQYLNALKGMELFGDNPKDGELKTGLDALASSSPNPEVKAKATALLSSLFGAQPSGQALLPATPDEPVKGKKKK